MSTPHNVLNVKQMVQFRYYETHSSSAEPSTCTATEQLTNTYFLFRRPDPPDPSTVLTVCKYANFYVSRTRHPPAHHLASTTGSNTAIDAVRAPRTAKEGGATAAAVTMTQRIDLGDVPERNLQY